MIFRFVRFRLQLVFSTYFSGPVFTIQIDPEGDIVTGGGKDGRIVATNPEGEILDETSLPEYVGGARCVVLSGDGVVYVGTTRNGIMKMNFEEEFTTIMQVNHRLPKNVFSLSIFIYFILISGSL